MALVAGTATADCGGGCGGSLAGTPADEFVAARLGLLREWVVQIPFDSARGTLEHVVVGDGLVVAQTSDGGVHAVQAAGFAGAKAGEPAPGTLAWSRRLGASGGVATPPGIGPSLVTVTRDLELLAFDRRTGAACWQRPLGRLPDGGAVEIGDWVYVPLSGNGIARLTSNPFQPTADPDTSSTPAPTTARDKAGKQPPVKEARPTSESLRTKTLTSAGPVERPVRPLGEGVAWATVDGVLVALVPVKDTWDRFEFALNSPAVATPITSGTSVFAATAAGDLARIDLAGADGLRTVWHVVLDAEPDAGPFLGGDTVVVSLGVDGLAAFSAETGAARWRSAIAGTVLAITGDRVWIIDRTGRLAGIDLETGDRRERICLGGFSRPIVNAESDRLLLASPDGLLVSLAPRRSAAKTAPRPAAGEAKPAPAAVPDAGKNVPAAPAAT